MSQVAGGWRSNLELKAQCHDLAAAAAAAARLGAGDADVLHQIDTYFRATAGRLKLRQVRSDRAPTQRAELIHYSRPNETRQRVCDYTLVDIPDGPGLIAALERAIGLRGVVRKTRRLMLWHNVRIHLDTVEHLGTFLEFEAVLDELPGNDPESSAARLDQLRSAIGIADRDLIDRSYSDLLGI